MFSKGEKSESCFWLSLRNTLAQSTKSFRRNFNICRNKNAQKKKQMMIDLFALNYSTFDHHNEVNTKFSYMTNKHEIMSKFKWNFIHKKNENNRKHKVSELSNNDDVPYSLPIPHEDCNVLTVESVSKNDDVALYHQQCSSINIPSLSPKTNEDCTEITENSPKRIPDLYACVFDKALCCKELILMKEKKELCVPDLCTCIVDKILSYKEFILIKEK